MIHGNLPLHLFAWKNKPRIFSSGESHIQWETSPQTDLWKRTYYGFSKINAPFYYIDREGNFTFSLRVLSETVNTYDQAGLFLMANEDHWVKASVEFENAEFSRLGSVVTTAGYSDWASVDIPPAIAPKWFRISRLSNDFLLEVSDDGTNFTQMRLFHLPGAPRIVRVGAYACSPGNSSFKTHFSEFQISPVVWHPYSPH